MYGYEFSGVEYSVLFENEDLGFAKRNPSIPNTFHLSPSPFSTHSSDHYYVFENQPIPEENKLVKVRAKETDKIVDQYGFKYSFVHYVKNWEYMNPSKIIRRELISKDEYTDYFSIPFSGEESAIESIGGALGMMAVSSPKALTFESGGMSSAVFGKDQDWTIYKRLFSIIPEDLLTQKSDVSYQFINKPLAYQNYSNQEINIAMKRPEATPVHMPVLLTSRQFHVETIPFKDYIDNLNYMQPLVTGRIIDSLMFQPKIKKSLEKTVADSLYTLINEISQITDIPYNQALGSAIPKLTNATARSNLTEKTSKSYVKNSLEMWEDMFYFTVINNSGQKTTTQPKMSRESNVLLGEITSAFSFDTKVPLEDVRNASRHDDKDFNACLQDLHNRGKVLFFSNDQKEVVYILDTQNN